ncbi:hypothetical protein BKA62DRAFT_766277 [Auriculariales sp. MPI-PUGE-AT-0066]|nr:hypothetical protein BKA62DRAFT_766277 [Auriculariales sp. MPI-PUGE-AT-0066]
MDAIDTNWCTVCERAIQSTNNLYCSDACRAKEERNARASRSSRLPSTQAPRPGQIQFELEDRQPEGYDSRKQRNIERWRHTVRPLAAADLHNHITGSPRVLSYPSTPALSPRASTSSLVANDFPPPSPAHLPVLHSGMSRMVSTDSESLCPPTTVGLTADDSPIATPPAQSEADTPAVVGAAVSASPSRFGRLHSLTARLISSPSPASVSASYEEAGRRSFEKRNLVRPARAVAIDIPVRQSPNVGFHRYRPKDEQPRHRVFSNDDDEDSSFSPSRRQPLVVRFSTQPE